MSAGRSLSGSRLLLRPFEEPDVTDDYLSWLADPDVTRYLEVRHQAIDREAAVRYLARFRGSADELYAIVERASGSHIGTVTLNNVDRIHGTADTGLLIGRKDLWGKGYAAEAWTLVIRHAFRDLALRKIIAGACAGNGASIAVLRRLGFVLEGTLRGECLVDGLHQDALRFGLYEGEFTASRPG